MFKAHNPLAAAVGADKGLHVGVALKSAEQQLQRMQDPMRRSLQEWVDEIVALSREAEPDVSRLAWLANGVLGVAGACELEAVSRCGGLFGRAIEAMGQGGWRADAARLYAASLVRLLAGDCQKAEQATVLASLEAMTRRLSEAGPDASRPQIGAPA